MLPHRFVVREERDVRNPRNSLDLNARAPGDTDVDVLPSGPGTGAHPAGASHESPQDIGYFRRLLRRPHVRRGHGFDQGHPKAVGEINPPVAHVTHLPAGILLESQLNDANPAPFVRDRSIDADNGGSLKAGGDAAVQVLFPGDVDLVDHRAAVKKPDAQGDIERFVVKLKRRSIIHLVRADGVAVDLVNDLLPRFELHQCGAVVLSQFREGRAHVSEDLGVEFFAIAAGGASAEELFFGEELLMDLKAGLETESGVVARGHFGERL